jgi:ATPase subunit of ABC transporter with duplicated ATPase domains
MLTLQNVTYRHPHKDLLFEHLNLSIDRETKISLIGNNGIGKSTLLKAMPDADKMKLGFDNAALHKGKILFTAKDINYGYDEQLLWKQGLSFQLISGERVVLKGLNGSGKTTLIKIILGRIEPITGNIFRADNKSVYIDQDYSLLDNDLTVYTQAASFQSCCITGT